MKRRRQRDTTPVEVIDDPTLPLLRGAAAEEFPKPRVDSGQVRWRPDTFKPGLAMDSHGDPVHNLVMRDAPPEAGQRVQRAMAAAARQRQRTEKRHAARLALAEARQRAADIEATLRAAQRDLVEMHGRIVTSLPDEVQEMLSQWLRDVIPAAANEDDVNELKVALELGFMAAVHRYRDQLTGNPEVDRILAGEAKRKSKLDTGRQTQSARKMERARKARAMYDAGVSVADIAKYFRDNEPQMKCNPETVRRWLREVMK